MTRGLFSGAIWGVVVAGLGAGGLSLAYPDFKPGEAANTPMPVATTPVATPEPESAAMESAAPEVVAEAAPETAMQAPTEAPTETPAAPEPDTEMAQSTPESDADQATSEAESEKPTVTPEVAEEGETDAIEMATQESEAPETVDPIADVVNIDEADTSDDSLSDLEIEIASPAEPPVDAPADGPAVEPEETPTETSTIAETTESITDEIIAALPKPEGTVRDLAPNVTTNRLPSVTDDAEPEADAPSAVARPPFERFKSSFEADSDKPRMSIVLIDDGEGALGVEALEAFPYPLTFAVDASKPNASERMQVYRDKGFEVLALVDLPRGATPADVEVAMSAYFAAIPEAVGILEGVTTGVQSSREMADQLTQIVLDSGHGMVLQSSGLNTARKLAEREGIPAGTVFRDFDGNGQSASVMRRFLDQAAFRAGQEGGVVMLGRLQAETISALLIWGLADRASRVALVPVTQVLKQDDAAEG